jgi:fatty acid-binding protein DegV
MSNVLSKYVADRLGDLESVDLSRVFITHSGMSDPELVDKVREAVLAIAPFEDVQVTRAGCTVSMHCGPNTLGVLFCKK